MGFLEDWRRLNVAITRARRGLVIVGHGSTLAASGGSWAAYLAWLAANGAIVPMAEAMGRLSTYIRSP